MPACVDLNLTVKLAYAVRAGHTVRILIETPSMLHASSLQLLATADAHLQRATSPRMSLCPTRRQATSLVEIGERLLDEHVAPRAGEAFAGALAAMADAQCDSFPDNLFWDFDYPAIVLLRCAQADPANPALRILEPRRRIVELEALFGAHSPVRFPYAHDFVYGFAWARWVERDIAARGAIGPFGLEFLDDVLCQGRELIELIRCGMSPPLPQGVARNPFGFSRDPAAEERLHRDLAARGYIPVETWRFDAEPRWDRPYRALREQRAKALGLMD
jgi:hypothetical protein